MHVDYHLSQYSVVELLSESMQRHTPSLALAPLASIYRATLCS